MHVCVCVIMQCELQTTCTSHSFTPTLHLIVVIYSVPADESPMLLHQWAGVLREGTATPSDSQGGGTVGGAKETGVRSAVGEGGTGDGETPESQQNAASEHEVNDSSGEDDSGTWSTILMVSSFQQYSY